MIYYSIEPDKYLLEKKIESIFLESKCQEKVLGLDSAAALLGHLEKKSFFSERRGLWARNILAADDGSVERIIELFGLGHKDDIVIITHDTKPPKSKLFGWLKENGKELALGANSINPRDFIRERVKAEGGIIAPLATERLGSLLGKDFLAISEEVKKLVLYKTKDGASVEIEHTDVEYLVTGGIQNNIFNLIDSVANKNKKMALKQIRSFIQVGENALYIHAMIYRQIRNIALIKFEPGLRESDLSKKLGIHPFVAKKTISQAKNFSPVEILELYGKLSDVDFRLKSGADPEQSLYALVI